MNFISSPALADAAMAVSTAIDRARSELHSQQCDIAEGSLSPKAKIEAILQINELSNKLGRIGGRQVKQLWNIVNCNNAANERI